jgi:sialidase-1
MIKTLLLSILILTFLGCKKGDNVELDLEIDEKIENKGELIKLDTTLKSLSIEYKYILSANQNSSYNYAYPEITFLGENNLMIVAKSSATNIEDFAKADLIKMVSKDDGRTWKEEGYTSTKFPDAINSSMPSIVRINQTKLLLIYSVKYSLTRIDLFSEESEDNGKTWSPPRIIYGINQGYQIVNNSRVILHNGRIILPVSIPIGGDLNNYLIRQGNLMTYYYFSDDSGKTWTKSKALKSDKVDLLEPGIVSFDNNSLLMNIRTDIGKVLFVRSENYGSSWHFEESNIHSPSAPQTIKRIPKTDTLLMVWNDNVKNPNIHGGNRSPLSLAISTNNGYNWHKITEIEPFNNFTKDHGYAAIEFDKDFVYIAYNERRNDNSSFAIKLAKFKRANLN